MNRTTKRQARHQAELLVTVRLRRRKLGIDEHHRTRDAVSIGEVLKDLENLWRPLPELEVVE